MENLEETIEYVEENAEIHISSEIIGIFYILKNSNLYSQEMIKKIEGKTALFYFYLIIN